MPGDKSEPISPPSEKEENDDTGLPKDLSKNVSAPPCDECCRPDFIYGGPFIKVPKPDPLLNLGTPVNALLQGTFKKSYAYLSLKERLPVIMTKVIDYFSRGKAKDAGASADDEQTYIQFVAQLINELVTNKEYQPFTVDTDEGKKWNEWIENQDNKHYFTNSWLFSECYVYRKLWEGVELRESLRKVDYFSEMKQEAIDGNLEIMCLVADKVTGMLPQSAKDQRKADFITLLKLCLWSNKCDMSLSLGQPVTLVDPFQMIIDNKDKLLVDDSGKAADAIVNKADNVRKAIDTASTATFKFQCSCNRVAAAFGMPLAEEKKAPSANEGEENKEEVKEDAERPQIPCPAKMTIPQNAFFDIVCDNAGYEVFTDLCLAHFLVSQDIVQKVRFHLKKMPWFVSDVTPKDFHNLINACKNANYSRTVQPEPKPAPPGGEAPPPEEPKQITADKLREMATQWSKFVEDGTFLIMAEDYWTYPHPYKDMKKFDYNLYRKLQYAVAILFKGDLNYRKLLGEKNWVPTTGFEASLQGFIPASILACRTVKSEVISGLAKGKFQQVAKMDEKWMEKGIYGTIQFCAKAEPLKVADRPCIDYGKTCFGKVCPVHTDM